MSEAAEPGALSRMSGVFSTTHWSVVLAARDEADPSRAQAALDELCRAYWFPLYVYARRRGQSPQDAEDSVQGYFAALIEKDYLAQADRRRGKSDDYPDHRRGDFVPGRETELRVRPACRGRDHSPVAHR